MTPQTVEEINFFDEKTNDCPYDAYRQMRDDAPVWQDPITGMWTLTRYEDIRAALLDPARFTNRIGNSAGAPPVASQIIRAKFVIWRATPARRKGSTVSTPLATDPESWAVAPTNTASAEAARLSAILRSTNP